MKKISWWLTLSLFFFSCGKNKDFFVYIFSTNSESKEGNIVLEYNSTDLPISHIGISLDGLFVYNISYNKKNDKNSALIKEHYTEFWDSKNSDNNKLWKIKVSKQEYFSIKQYIQNLEKQTIFYDLDPNTSEGLYCSEFVYQALNTANPDRFNIQKSTKSLTGIAQILLNKDSLEYYPADFFLAYDLTETKQHFPN